MAVPENAGVKIGSTSQNLDSKHSNRQSGLEKPKPRNDEAVKSPTDADSDNESSVNGGAQVGQMRNGFEKKSQQILVKGLKSKDIGDLAEILSKLNPMAEEFVPPSIAYHSYNIGNYGYLSDGGLGFGYANNFVVHPGAININELITPGRVRLQLRFILSRDLLSFLFLQSCMIGVISWTIWWRRGDLNLAFTFYLRLIDCSSIHSFVSCSDGLVVLSYYSEEE